MGNNNEKSISPEDRELFHKMAQDIRNNPVKYREAGKWLDEYCAEEAYWQRQENELEKLRAQEKELPTLPIVQRVRHLEEEIRIKRTPALLVRFQEARDYLFEKYKQDQFIPEDDGKRILVITWLLTDPDAEKLDLGITERERWPWEPLDDVSKMSRGYAAFLWCHGGRIYEPWMRLLHIAWLKVGPKEQAKVRSGEQRPILGETWTVAGITIHLRNLLSRLRKLKAWQKLICYPLLGIAILSIVSFLTRSFWAPLIPRIGRHSRPMKDSPRMKVPVSLKDICEDIESRPLVQQEETAKRYIGLQIQNERVLLFDVTESGGMFGLMVILPDQVVGGYVSGRYIRCSVERNKYPQLVAAKRGVELRVSGRITDISTVYIDLSNVSLTFE